MVNDNSDDIIKNGDPIPPGYELLKHVEQMQNNQTRLEQFIVKKKPENGLAGDIMKNARWAAITWASRRLILN